MINDPRNILDQQLQNESVILKFVSDNREIEKLSESWWVDFFLGIALWGMSTGSIKKG